MNFDLCIGIDYSGAKTPVSRSSALQVYESRSGEEPQTVLSPAVDRQIETQLVPARNRELAGRSGSARHSIHRRLSIMDSRFQSATLSVTDSGLGISF